jgi:hypothetical protein
MNILFRSKKLIIKAYTYSSVAYESYALAQAHSFYPEWCRKLSAVETCAGIVDMYKHGIVLPLWSDLQIKVAEHGHWYGAFSDGTIKQPLSHARYQIGEDNSEFSNYILVRLNAPWLLVDVNNTGISFLETGCFWNNISIQHTFEVCPGILNFKHQHSLNIVALLSKAPGEFLITANTPMSQVVPLSERPLELQVELIKKDAWEQLNNKHADASFYNKYERLKKITMQKEMQSKCPFSKLFSK